MTKEDYDRLAKALKEGFRGSWRDQATVDLLKKEVCISVSMCLEEIADNNDAYDINNFLNKCDIAC